MTKGDFWHLIAEAKKECGQDMDIFADWLKEHLVKQGAQHAQDFHDILHGYQQLADQYGLWSAATILCDGCSDDGFIDFRAWLIAQGREVYLAALKDPDSLADVEPYEDCQFKSLTYVGSTALELLTGHDAYGGSDPFAYDTLVEELKQDIVYGKRIGYPYEQNEFPSAFPRLCAKHLTPEILSAMTEHGSTWNLNAPQVQAARMAGPEKAPIRRLRSQSEPKAKVPEVPAPHDVEQIITDMRTETIRGIRQDRELPEGQLAWYWSYIGALNMAQELGLITKERCQELHCEARGFKPDCVVTSKNFEQDIGTTTEITIGGMQ